MNIQKINIARQRIAIGSAAATAAIVLFAAALVLTRSGVLATGALLKAPSETTGDESSGDSQDDSLSGDIQPAGTVFAHPDLMKGAWLVAGTDYDQSGSDTGETVKEQIDAAFKTLSEWNWNTVIVPLSKNDQPLYASNAAANRTEFQPIKNADGTTFDPIDYIRQCAKERGMFVYGVLDIRIGTKDGWNPATPEGAKAIHDMANEAAANYPLDGYLLDNVGYIDIVDLAKGSGDSDASGMQQNTGAAPGTSMRDSITACVQDAVQTIKSADANAYVGLLADPVWANKADNERGSDTNGAYASYTDGNADTLGWLQNELFDFVMVKDDCSTADGSAPFETVLKWWAAACSQKGVPLYISHAANKACGSEPGWESPDQLARQVLACEKTDGWKGSAFYTLSALQNDSSGSTNAIQKAFSGELNEEDIARTLTIGTPTRRDITTYEPTVKFLGIADPNFPLTLNGQPVPLSDHGFFSLDLNLSLGQNTFTFEHKGKTITFTVTYKIVVLKSVEPASKLELDGGSAISVGAVAHKGASVYAKIKGTTISMKETEVQSDDKDTSADSSDYVNYSGTYLLPSSIAGQEQNLGAVTVYGTYAGMSETKTGGTIIVKPASGYSNCNPNPDAYQDGGSDPIDPGNGDTVLRSGEIVWISKSYAETFSGNTTDDWSRPTNAYMPRGTTDVIVKSAYDSVSGKQYYLLGCGRRVYQDSVSIYKESGSLTANSLNSGCTVDSDSTKVVLDASWHIPYNLQLLPQSYDNPSKQKYDISSFTATYVDITFSYTDKISGAPDVSSSPLLSSAEWIGGDNNTYTLRLHLRKAGGFYGYSVKWDNAQLVFTFWHPQPASSGSKPLSGKRIVIDPGHGGNSTGTAGGGIAEKTLTLKYGLMLKDKLETLGATVVMTRSSDVNPDNALSPPSLDARNAYARNNGTDLFISIHMDGSDSNVRGYTVYYFNEYSQRYAKAVNSRLKNAGLGTDSRGTQWKYFNVMRLHDCPSILIECGYMSNAQDLELLISPDFQEKFTSALADGIVDYFNNI